METAYQRGIIHPLMFQYGAITIIACYKGAKLMEQAMNDGIEKNLRNLKFLGQSWSLAKEQDKAIPVMMQAAELSEDGG